MIEHTSKTAITIPILYNNKFIRLSL